MKLIPVEYHGFISIDHRFSSAMLHWIVAEVRSRHHTEKLSLGVDHGTLQAYNMDFELQYSHRISQITTFSQADFDGCVFLYLLQNYGTTCLYCYVFRAQEYRDVTDLYNQMKEQNYAAVTRSVSSAATLTSLCVDISPSSSNFFEVLYIGKIKNWQTYVSDTFIDDALEKFKLHELEKAKDTTKSEASSSESSSTAVVKKSVPNYSPIPEIRDGYKFSVDSSQLVTSPAALYDEHLDKDIEEDNIKCQDPNDESSKSSTESLESEKNKSLEPDDHNRTMVLQVDRTDLRLISPDRKLILLHKHHKDVVSCMQGNVKSDHFGFVCRENNGEMIANIGYIFKCESSSIAADLVAAITQAFLNNENKGGAMITSCEHCPMVWFHKLCIEVEHMSDRKTQAIVLRRLDQLESEEQASILAKFRNTVAESVREQNEVFMILLRAHCAEKQIRHIHDTAENRSEFLNHYLGVGGSNVFTKAKKTLSNSFDQFMKKKRMSVGDLGAESRNMSLPLTNNHNKDSTVEAWSEVQASETSNLDRNSEDSYRSRYSTLDSRHGDKETYLSVKNSKQPSTSPERYPADPVKSSMIDIFLKVGNSPRVNPKKELDAGSWRQAIFKRVVTPKKNQMMDEPKKRRTKEDLRVLWKQAIRQALLLVRMDKENERLKTQQEESAVKRIKLEYDEMKPGQREVMEVWEMIANKESQFKINKNMLLQAIKQGVPRGRRGDVWQFLAEQHCLKSAPPDPSKYPNYNTPYVQLLKQLTSHQHAILIDLGRTFPNHSYFSSPLGPGQLALFNLLKAYSLLDPEVGYCQGLSFVAGVLLLHLEEAKAFSLLRHLMFRRGMRYQYLPDMSDIQIKLYQLSRAIHDHLPELYRHLDIHEVAPTLYAAPWILTMFASQFPLGFVTRVFDLVFLEGPDIIFRVELALLNHHKDEILSCECFEDIMDYFKNQLTLIDKSTLDKLIKYIYATDITKQLEEYRVEYQVLQEEMTAVQPKEEEIHKLESENKILAAENKALTGQLGMVLGNVQRLEKNRVLQQSQLNRLEMQSRGLEVTVAALGNFINNLIEEKVDIDFPDEIRRILSQITLSEKKRTEKKGQGYLLKMIQEKNDRIQPPDRLMVKSLSTGKINMPSTIESMSRANSLDVSAEIISNQLKNQFQKANSGSTEKKSFFSNSHSNILEQQRSSLSCSNVTSSRINIKVDEIDDDEQAHEDVQSNENKNTSPTHSIDSGVGTPQSPRITDIHPLSNCDVSFTYSGTKELKNLKSMKKRQSSPEVFEPN